MQSQTGSIQNSKCWQNTQRRTSKTNSPAQQLRANTIEKQAKATGEHIINLTEAYTRQLVTLIKSNTTETMKKMLGLLAKANTNTLTNLTNPTNNE
jgi:hypothetical protein